MTLPVTVTVQSQTSDPYPDLSVYAFDGTTYTGYHGTTDANGQATFTLPQGSYRFRADYDGVQFWSTQANGCTVPGCTSTIVTLPGGTGQTTTTIDYVYDPLYRLTSAEYSSGDSYQYAYDSVGNRLTQDSNISGQQSAVSYNYDIANRLTDVDGVPYVYDANGNLLNDEVNTYAYDSANRLTSVTGSSSSDSYTYNGLGDRLSQNGIQYTLDLNMGLTQILDDGTNTYTYGLGRISQSHTETEYFMGDALGSVRQLVNDDSEITLAKAYAPYGEVLSADGSGTSLFAFTGEQVDVSGLTYLRARYYASGTGRFLTKDPSGLERNPYLYASASPINKVDPTGLCSQDYWGWDDTSGLFTDANCKALDADASPYAFTKQWYTQLATQMRSDGLGQAATNMEHFLNGSGADLTLSASWVNQTITTGMPDIKKDIDKLVKWWVRKYFDSLQTCVETPIVPGSVLSTTWTTKEGYTPSYWQATSKNSPDELTDIAAALGGFRVDVEIGGNLHRKPGGLFSSDYVDANLQIKVVVMDVYDWHPGLGVTYPRRENKILDNWAHRLEVAQGTPNGFLVSGEYIYTENLTNIKKGILLNSPPNPWIVTSCIGSRFDIDAGGNGTLDYCDYKNYPRITPP